MADFSSSSRGSEGSSSPSPKSKTGRPRTCGRASGFVKNRSMLASQTPNRGEPLATIRRRRLPSGKTAWQVDYKDGSGKRHRHEFTDKQSAEARFARAVQEERQAKPAPSTLANATVKEFSELWLAAIKTTVATKTYSSYAQILKLYIIPVIGEERMLALHEGTVGGLLTAWTNKGKSANTIRL